MSQFTWKNGKKQKHVAEIRTTNGIHKRKISSWQQATTKLCKSGNYENSILLEKRLNVIVEPFPLSDELLLRNAEKLLPIIARHLKLAALKSKRSLFANVLSEMPSWPNAFFWQNMALEEFCKLSFLSDCLQLKAGSTDTHSLLSWYARNRSLAVFSLLGFSVQRSPAVFSGCGGRVL